MKAPWYCFIILGTFTPYFLGLASYLKENKNLCVDDFKKFNKKLYYTLNIIVDLIFSFFAFGVLYNFEVSETVGWYSLVYIGVNGRGIIDQFVKEIRSKTEVIEENNT